MTRGRIVLITDNEVLVTDEFNGDMSPSVNGVDIIEAFKGFRIKDVNSFSEFIREFNGHHYGYPDDNLITLHKKNGYSPSQTIALFADYTYIINISRTGYDSNGLYPNTLCIYKYKEENPFKTFVKEQKTSLSDSKHKFLSELIKNAIALADITREDAVALLKEMEDYYR